MMNSRDANGPTTDSGTEWPPDGSGGIHGVRPPDELAPAGYGAGPGRPEFTEPVSLERLVDHVRSNASLYFPDLRSRPEVALIQQSVRPASQLYRFEVRSGPRVEALLVKVPLMRATLDSGPAGGRPRMVLPASAETKFLLEHSALLDIHRHFSWLADRRFATVRPLDKLLAERAIILEHVPSTNLRDLLYGARHLLTRPSPGLIYTLERAGAWLRTFHSIETTLPPAERGATREDLIGFVERCGEYLARRVPDGVFVERAVAAIVRAAEEHLPTNVPVCTSHGDFALRNILVRPDSRIAVIDTLARFRAPAYEDLATLLHSVRCARTQLVTFGLARQRGLLDRLEVAFLSGYGGDVAIDMPALRVFELQSTLDSWAAAVARQRPLNVGNVAGLTSRIPFRWRPRPAVRVFDRGMRFRIESLLDDLERPSRRWTSPTAAGNTVEPQHHKPTL
jgi:hypothetical protein